MVIGTDARYVASRLEPPNGLRAAHLIPDEFGEEGETGFLEWALALLVPTPGGRVLDVGSAPRPYHRLLSARGMQVTALDLSAGMLRAASTEALNEGADVEAMPDTSKRFPFRDSSFDRAICHQEPHRVFGTGSALREVRRILKPGGRAVLVAGSAGRLEPLWSLHKDSARLLGYRAQALVAESFTLRSADLVRRVFPRVTVHLYASSLRFTSLQPALGYYATAMVDCIENPLPGGSHRVRLMEAMGERISRIIAQEGEFRASTALGCFAVRT